MRKTVYFWNPSAGKSSWEHPLMDVSDLDGRFPENFQDKQTLQAAHRRNMMAFDDLCRGFHWSAGCCHGSHS